MRANIPWPSSHGVVRFVGGVPSRIYGEVDVERVYEGEVRGEPILSDGVAWVRVHIYGVGDDLLVPVENLRP